MNSSDIVIVCMGAVAVLALASFLGVLRALFRERKRSGSIDRELATSVERCRQLEASRSEMAEFLRAQGAVQEVDGLADEFGLDDDAEFQPLVADAGLLGQHPGHELRLDVRRA